MSKKVSYDIIFNNEREKLKKKIFKDYSEGISVHKSMLSLLAEGMKENGLQPVLVKDHDGKEIMLRYDSNMNVFFRILSHC